MKNRNSNYKIICGFLAAAFFVFAFALSAPHIIAQQTAFYNGRTIVIDAGHGGIDGGVRGAYTRNKESDINLYVSRALRTILRKRGYKVVMTRTDENGLYDETAASKKQSDMQKRKEIIESVAPTLVVSVHQNFFPDSSVSGAQVFYAPSSVESERIAATIQGVLCDKLGSNRVHKSADYYVLQCSPYPSVLIECAFMSNEKEDKLLSTSAFREKVALAVADGIDAALSQIEPESV